MRLFFLILLFALLSKVSASEAKLDSLKQALKTQTKIDTNRLNTLNGIAFILRTDEPEEAFKFLKEAETIGKQIGSHKKLAKTYNLFGICFKGLGELDSALSYYEKGLSASINAKDSVTMGFLYSNIGNVWKNKGKYDKAVEFYLKAANLQNILENYSGLSSAYNNIGLVYDDTDKNDKALEYYNLSLKYAVMDNDSEAISRCYSNMSIIFDEEGDNQKGLQYRQKALEIDRKLGNKRSISITLVNMGAYYSDNGNYKEALKYYDEALSLKKEIGDQKGLANLLNNLGIVYEELNKSTEAVNSFMEALKISKEHSFVELESASYKHLSDYYSGKDYKLAYQYHVLYKLMEDSIFNTESNKVLTEMETKYESDKKENENKLLQIENKLSTKELKQQKLIIYIVIGGLFLSLFFAYFIFRGLKKQRKANHIITLQKKEVEEKRNQIEHQKELIEEKHKEITDSINYAERIQRSFLATEEMLNKHLKDYFIFFLPKDVVSGDFYWSGILKDESFALVTADSTGHGVPGAIMSLLNITSLEKAIEQGLTSPSDIFNYTRKNIIERLKKDGSKDGGKDGMDASLICIDKNYKFIRYAAANNPIWIVRSGEILELKPDKMPIGKHDRDTTPFTEHKFDLQNGDLIYTLTDGLPDQFGGIKGKKFMYKQLKELLIEHAHKSMPEQKNIFEKHLHEWKGHYEQIDDITLIGIRITHS